MKRFWISILIWSISACASEVQTSPDVALTKSKLANTAVAHALEDMLYRMSDDVDVDSHAACWQEDDGYTLRCHVCKRPGNTNCYPWVVGVSAPGVTIAGAAYLNTNDPETESLTDDVYFLVPNRTGWEYAYSSVCDQSGCRDQD